MDVLYPEISVPLSGQDGNAFFIIGRISSALKRHAVPKDKIDEFRKQAMSGDYDNVLQTAMRWVSVS